MKKIMMTICGAALISTATLAQRVDSTYNRNSTSGDVNQMGTQDRTLNQSTNPQSIQAVPRKQDQTSPTLQPTQQQPTVQPAPQQQVQPQSQIQSESQPLQTQPQVPTQPQPAYDPNNQSQQNQLNQPVQPTTNPPSSTGGNSSGTPQ